MAARTVVGFTRANTTAVGFHHGQCGNVPHFDGEFLLRVQRDVLLLVFTQFAAGFVGLHQQDRPLQRSSRGDRRPLIQHVTALLYKFANFEISFDMGL